MHRETFLIYKTFQYSIYYNIKELIFKRKKVSSIYLLFLIMDEPFMPKSLGFSMRIQISKCYL